LNVSDPKILLTPQKAAELLRERYGFGSVAGLAKWRTAGGGPRFRKLGRAVLYDRDQVIAWAESRISQPFTSTSEAGSACPEGDGRRRGRPRKGTEEERQEPAETAA
jgi:hypothetical protein